MAKKATRILLSEKTFDFELNKYKTQHLHKIRAQNEYKATEICSDDYWQKLKEHKKACSTKKDFRKNPRAF